MAARLGTATTALGVVVNKKENEIGVIVMFRPTSDRRSSKRCVGVAIVGKKRMGSAARDDGAVRVQGR